MYRNRQGITLYQQRQQHSEKNIVTSQSGLEIQKKANSDCDRIQSESDYEIRFNNENESDYEIRFNNENGLGNEISLNAKLNIESKMRITILKLKGQNIDSLFYFIKAVKRVVKKKGVLYGQTINQGAVSESSRKLCGTSERGS